MRCKTKGVILGARDSGMFGFRMVEVGHGGSRGFHCTVTILA